MHSDTRLMPALSIRQPWAWLIVNGFKDIENRDWTTKFRGAVLIHAGKTLTRDYYDEQASAIARAGLMPPGFPPFDELPRGGVVGQARIVDCVSESTSPWFIPGGYGFVIRDARPVPFFPVRGQLGFFDVRVMREAAHA